MDIKYNKALQLADDNEAKPQRLMYVGHLLGLQYLLCRSNTALDKAIVAFEAADRIAPDDPEFQAKLHNSLGQALTFRFEYSGRTPDIDRAIVAFEHSLMLTPDDDVEKPDRLKDLGESYCSRFECSSDIADIDRAISALEEALHLTDGDDDMPEYLNSLGDAFLTLFEHSHDLNDCASAILAQQQALDLTPDGDDEKADRLNDLGNSFQSRFEHTRDITDSDRAISTYEQAVDLALGGDTDKSRFLSNLGNSLLLRFEHSGDLADSDRTISAHEKAVNLTPDDHVDKPQCLSHLGNAFESRFEHFGNLVDIDRAISVHERAVSLTSDGHADWSTCLVNLGNSLSRRFIRSDDLVDINRAIYVHERGVNHTPDGHPNKPGCLNNLGCSYMALFEHSNIRVDIDKAISAHERAVSLIPNDHPEKPMYLTNLGSSFMCRFLDSDDPVDTDKAISAHKRAVNMIIDGDTNKYRCLSNLGTSLWSRFECSNDLLDCDRAISAHDQAANLIPDGHGDKPTCLSKLGDVLASRFEHSGNLADRNRAISYYRSTATSSIGRAFIRFTAALSWARLASGADKLKGYTVALDLVSQVVWLGQSITARHRQLSSMDAVASEAAAAACEVEKYETALEWLEQGRLIVWNQLSSLRTPADALRVKDASLADALTHVSIALEHASTGNSAMRRHLGWSYKGRSYKEPSMEEVAQQHRRLAEEWEQLVGRARAIGGFEDFLRPKKFAQLRSAAKAGPVVVINVHTSRCDALLLVDSFDKVVHIPLQGLSYEKAQQLHHCLNQLLLAADVRARDTRAIRRVTTTKGPDFPYILSYLWSSIVKPVLDRLAFTVSSLFFIYTIKLRSSKCTTDPPRIWWCATGPLAFLPIHAAGIYNTSEVGINISDYVVSSYAPTLTAIINVDQTRHPFRGLLAVSQPNTPGQFALPSTEVELDLIQEHAYKFNVRLLRGSKALMGKVIDGMETHSWVHFACHAVQETEPTKSAFCLYDKRLELATIITKSFPHADFAFLSACQTATGDEQLSEEAVHLAAGMMLAGYRGVIATMWSIKDTDGPVIAGHVYEELFRDTEPDSTRAALALHGAVKLLRQQVGDSAFLSWVPFIHVGV